MRRAAAEHFLHATKNHSCIHKCGKMSQYLILEFLFIYFYPIAKGNGDKRRRPAGNKLMKYLNSLEFPSGVWPCAMKLSMRILYQYFIQLLTTYFDQKCRQNRSRRFFEEKKLKISGNLFGFWWELRTTEKLVVLKAIVI